MASILLDELIAEVAQLAYQDLPDLEAKKKVRDRAYYARKQGQITVTGNASVGLRASRIHFLRWAQESWPEIQAALKLPNEGSMAATLPPLTMQLDAVTPPTDADELRLAYILKSALLDKSAKELALCRADNKALENELADLKRRKETIRKARSDAGKQGGRGREK